MRWLAALALAFCIMVGPAAAGPMEDTQANIHFNLALKLYQAQRLDEAKQTLAKALALVPEHPQANFLVGLIDCQQNHYDEAIAPLKLAASGLQDKPETQADVLMNLGVAYFQLGKLGEAEDALKKAAVLQPQRGDVAMNLGLVALRMKQYPTAETYFSRAADLDKGSSRAWLGLGEAADGVGDTQNALDAREKALTIEPQDKTLRLELGERLYQDQRITQAAEVLQPLEGAGDSTAEFLLGVLQYRQGAFDASRERFEAALVDRPDYPEARFNLAITFYDQGLFDDALKQFQAVLDKHPDDQDARKNLDITRQAAVRSWLKRGSEDFLKADYSSALNRWKSALAIDPTNKVVKDLVDTAETQLKLQAQELADQARKDWDQGKKEAAISEWAEALERDSANTTAKQGLEGAKAEIDKMADAFKQAAADDIAQGRWSMARDEASRVSNLDRGMGQALAQKVESAAKLQFDDAMAAADGADQKGALSLRVDSLERAVDAEPHDDAAQLKLNQAKVAFREALDGALAAADAAEKASNNNEAVKQYRRVLELQASNPQAKDALKRLGAKASAKGADPSYLEDLYYKGVYAYAAGNVEVAEADWKQVLSLDPKHALAREALDRSRRNREAAGRN